MERGLQEDGKGRKYAILIDRSGTEEMSIILGPPEGVVDELGLPEPFATTLHNILYDRGLLTYKDIAANQKVAIGALQEALAINAQKLVEAYFHFENETASP
jgi:hypothetical protein